MKQSKIKNVYIIPCKQSGEDSAFTRDLINKYYALIISRLLRQSSLLLGQKQVLISELIVTYKTEKNLRQNSDED